MVHYIIEILVKLGMKRDFSFDLSYGWYFRNGSRQASRLKTVQQSLRGGAFLKVSSSVTHTRRISTERCYQSHGRGWVHWAERRQVDYGNPPIPQLCIFLMYFIQEKQFTQGMVKSYRSAICTTIRQSGGPDLSVNLIENWSIL